MKTFALVVGLFALMMVSLPDRFAAQAQSGAVSADRYGRENGYRDGYFRGREDHVRGGDFDVHSEDYEHGDRGFGTFMGSRDDYKTAYRQAYREGYDDGWNQRRAQFQAYAARPGSDVYGYNQNARVYDNGENMRVYNAGDRPNPGGYWQQNPNNNNDLAYNNGFQDGKQAGGEDRAKDKSPNLKRHDSYQDADHGYHSEYGDKESYKQRYRRGYEDGYRSGYGAY